MQKRHAGSDGLAGGVELSHIVGRLRVKLERKRVEGREGGNERGRERGREGEREEKKGIEGGREGEKGEEVRDRERLWICVQLHRAYADSLHLGIAEGKEFLRFL